eukprot:COSAG02_NODE_32179_length_520_cov_16.743468_1_plen_88_part_00
MQSRVFIILVVPRYTSVHLVYTQCTPVVLVVVVVDLVLLLALPLPVLDLSTGILQGADERLRVDKHASAAGTRARSGKLCDQYPYNY